jgi:hypothetical protein
MAIKKSSGSGIPFGNNAGRPANPGTGQLYSNGQAQRLELYTSAGNWENIVQEVPGVSSITGNYSEQTDSGVITIYGTNFVSGAYATAIGANGVQINAASTTYVSLVQLIATFTGLSNAQEPYDIKVTNPSNLFGIIPDALYINASPVWVTASGSLGTFNELVSVSVSATATDSDSTISYALASGSTLPSGVTLNSSTGVISGTLPAIAADTTYNFTINASDGVNTIPRAFSITSSNTITWNTAAGSLGTFYELSSISTTLSATTPDSATVTYALESGSSLPSGLSLNSSTGTISGTLPNITTDTTYTFTINALQGPTTTPRTFSITSTAFADVSTVEVLVVAGGGGGGHGDVDGTQSSGGGAGGLVYNTDKNVSSWIGVAKTLTVGTGGPAGFSNTQSDGTNSILGDITALKGGAGGGGGATVGQGGSGTYGSGGGQGGSGGSASANNAQGTSGQGNQGGFGTGGPGDAAGGGGGAGGSGGNASGSTAGTGGIGRTISITGAAVGYAGGGGNNGDLGFGGGFNGSSANRQGKPNTGGGGKGSTGAGGSGVVVIAYPITVNAITTISAGLTYTVDTTTRAGYRVYRFTAGTGTITF